MGTSGTEGTKIPLPEPSDINKAGLVDFDDISLELKRVAASLQGKLMCDGRVCLEHVIYSYVLSADY